MSKKYDLRVLDMLKNYRKIAGDVKNIVKKIDVNAEVYVFGSVVRGKYTGASDIDIMIVTDKINLKYEIMTKVYKAVDAPIQLHIVTKDQLENWYKRFIAPDELEKI